jgi:peptidyl-tRNA hydrolase
MSTKRKGIEYAYVDKWHNRGNKEIVVTLITQSITILYSEIGYMNVDLYMVAGFGRTFR